MGRDTNSKVSIVVPCFNAQDDLEKSVGSVLVQSYFNIEVIVVDDYSDDSSFAVAQSLARSDSRVVAVRNEVKGANSARQLGVKLATGSFLMFLDADDYWDKDAVEKLLDVAFAMNADIVCCGMRMLVGDEVTSLFQYPVNNVAIDIDHEPRAVLDVPPSACAKIFRSTVIKNINFDDVPFAQDWNVTYKAVARSKVISFIDDPLYVYIRKIGSTSSLLKSTCCEELMGAEKSILGIVNYYEQLGRSNVFESVICSLVLRFYSNLLVRSYALPVLEDRFKYIKHLREVFHKTDWLKAFMNEEALRDKLKVFYLFCVLSVPGFHIAMGRYYKKKAKA